MGEPFCPGTFSPHGFLSAVRYVDAHRSVAVHLGTADLKVAMKGSGISTKSAHGEGAGPGEPNHAMYLKQAEHLMKRGAFAPAIEYLNEAIRMNPTSKVKLCALTSIV